MMHIFREVASFVPPALKPRPANWTLLMRTAALKYQTTKIDPLRSTDLVFSPSISVHHKFLIQQRTRGRAETLQSWLRAQPQVISVRHKCKHWFSLLQKCTHLIFDTYKWSAATVHLLKYYTKAQIQLYLCIFILCYFIFLLHHNLEGNILLLTLQQLFDSHTYYLKKTYEELLHVMYCYRLN